MKALCIKRQMGKKEDNFLFRFGIIHCVADSGVFGLLTHMPEGTNVKNDEWYKVEGTINLTIMNPSNGTFQL